MLNSTSETGNHCHIGHLENLGPLRAGNTPFTPSSASSPQRSREAHQNLLICRDEQKQNGISCAHAMDHLNWAATCGHNQVLFLENWGKNVFPEPNHVLDIHFSRFK